MDRVSNTIFIYRVLSSCVGLFFKCNCSLISLISSFPLLRSIHFIAALIVFFCFIGFWMSQLVRGNMLQLISFFYGYQPVACSKDRGRCRHLLPPVFLFCAIALHVVSFAGCGEFDYIFTSSETRLEFSMQR